MDRLVAVPRVVVGVLLVALVAALLWAMRPAPATNQLTAYFPRTVALYAGSDVRILGVTVGHVESIEPEGDRVKVTMNYETPVRRPRRRQGGHHLARHRR